MHEKIFFHPCLFWMVLQGIWALYYPTERHCTKLKFEKKKMNEKIKFCLDKTQLKYFVAAFRRDMGMLAILNKFIEIQGSGLTGSKLCTWNQKVMYVWYNTLLTLISKKLEFSGEELFLIIWLEFRCWYQETVHT